MKRLFLLRHAKSSWDDAGLPDHDRPLAPRGRRAAKLIAGHLAREGIEPELVLCSSSVRTRQTLERIGLNAPVEIEDALYAAPASELLARLRAVGSRVDSVMLIGHNPGIQDLALRLAGRGPDLDTMRRKFPTAALATLEFDGAWSDLAPATAELVAFVKPKQLT